MNSWQKKLEIATNVAILCAFLMVAALAAKRFFEHPLAANALTPQVGAAISLPGVDWKKSKFESGDGVEHGLPFLQRDRGFL
jgi:hypothetical protein